jgi:hypothetical protein
VLLSVNGALGTVRARKAKCHFGHVSPGFCAELGLFFFVGLLEAASGTQIKNQNKKMNRRRTARLRFLLPAQRAGCVP